MTPTEAPITYSAFIKVKGAINFSPCGHGHKTIEAAEQCIREKQRNLLYGKPWLTAGIRRNAATIREAK